MINVKKAIPVYNEVGLLSRSYGAAPKGRVNVESGCLGTIGSIHDNGPDIVKHTPVTSKVINIDEIVDRMTQWVVPGKREILYDAVAI